MSDELQQDVAIETEVPVETHEHTDFEKEQIANGWNPNGEKTAEEWASNTGFVEKIKKQSKQLKNLHKTIDHLKAFMEKQEKAAYDRAVAELKTQREHAVQNEDRKEIERIDREAQAIRPPSSEAQEFHSRNADWLTSPKPLEMKMTAFARQRDAELMQYQLSPADHMRVLEEHVRAEFPQYFENREKEVDDEEDDEPVVKKAPTVASSKGGNVAGAVTGKKKFTYHDLSPAQKEVANKFKHANIMSIEQYIAACVKNGDLK
jgi:hypothetical protein